MRINHVTTAIYCTFIRASNKGNYGTVDDHALSENIWMAPLQLTVGHKVSQCAYEFKTYPSERNRYHPSTFWKLFHVSTTVHCTTFDNRHREKKINTKMRADFHTSHSTLHRVITSLIWIKLSFKSCSMLHVQHTATEIHLLLIQFHDTNASFKT